MQDRTISAKKILAVALISFVFLALVAVMLKHFNSNKAEEKIYKVGLMAPLSGDAGEYGFSIQKAVEMAKNELGAKNIQIITEDTRCDPVLAKKAVEKLIKSGVQAIIGDVCSGATMAAVPYASKSKVVIVSPASTSVDLNSAGEYFFRTVPSDEEQAKFASDLIFGRGVKNLAVINSDENYGQKFFELLKEDYNRLGGQVVYRLPVGNDTEQLENDVKNMLSKVPEAVFVVSNSPYSAALSVKLVREQDEEIPIFGAEGMKSSTIAVQAGGQAEGLTVTAMAEPSIDFSQRFEAEFGVPPGPFASQGYDAFWAIYKAIKNGASNGIQIKDGLSKINFKGTSGNIKFMNNRGVKGKYGVFILHNGKFVKQ